MSSPAPWLDIRAKVEAAALLPVACVQWPNEPFTQPSGQLWMAVEATGDSLAPIELGGGVWQESGRAYFHIFTPAGWGSSDARQLAKDVSMLFRGLGPSNVVYLGGSIGIGEAADVEGAWWRLSVVIDWRYQDVLT